MCSHNIVFFFLTGEYLLGDSAYALTGTVIPSYKCPAANIQRNAEFNYCVAKARVRNEHCIGILKGRWSSLRELRLQLINKEDMQHIIDWSVCCAILHNMLADLGDQWTEIYLDEGRDYQVDKAFVLPDTASDTTRREQIRDWAVAANYTLEVLPLPSNRTTRTP